MPSFTRGHLLSFKKVLIMKEEMLDIYDEAGRWKLAPCGGAVYHQ